MNQSSASIRKRRARRSAPLLRQCYPPESPGGGNPPKKYLQIFRKIRKIRVCRLVHKSVTTRCATQPATAIQPAASIGRDGNSKGDNCRSIEENSQPRQSSNHDSAAQLKPCDGTKQLRNSARDAWTKSDREF